MGRPGRPQEGVLVILAGGQSRRMGTAKALLEVGGMPLVRWLAERLGGGFDEVLVSTGDPALACGLPVVPDLVPGAGPLAGVLSALTSAGRPVMAVACDMPLVTPEAVLAIWRALPGRDAAVPIAGGRSEPACAAWSPSAGPVIAEALEHGRRRMLDLLERLDVAWVDFPDGRLFSNLNTPEDYRAFLDAMRQHGTLERDRTLNGGR